MQACNKSELVYSSHTDIGKAVTATFEAMSSEKRVLKVSRMSRQPPS